MRIENFGFVQKAAKFGIKLAKLRFDSIVFATNVWNM